MKIVNVTKVKFLVTLLALCLAGSSVLFAASAASQLEKGKQLYAEERDNEAMDYFIDVLVSGTRAQVEEANQYINLIHNRLGGIQDPVEVDVNFKEGVLRRLQPGQDPAVLQAQLEAEQAAIAEEVAAVGLTATAAQDVLAMEGQNIQTAKAVKLENEEENAEDVDEQKTDSSSVFEDLTTPSALHARQVYTTQKVESMKQTAIAKLEKAKGVRIYFRNNLPDAIDIDSDVLFDGYKFRPEALPVLDEVYTLMALTQGASYIILPPGSYTDDITLSGIRQAMALNSFLVHKGLSSGKLSYNMGLFDQEPPAKFANLEGVSIVFDFDAELPASLPEAVSVNDRPMLSMAVVPVDNKIDPAAGEAFAIDFSVIETENPIENWVLQVIQHGANDNYYVVRQLEGYSPVYHQIVWNARKAMIGPEMPCGTYTLALTAVDVQGKKSTLRRQIDVACTLETAKAEAKKAAKNNSKKTTAEAADKKLDYKTARLWTKPGRVMKAVAVQPQETDLVDPTASMDADVNAADAYAVSQADPYAGDYNYNMPAYDTAVPAASQGVDNPYDMPYDTYGNN